jgi:hypothetical protein
MTVTGNTPIGEIVRKKGHAAAQLLETALCCENGVCRPCTTVRLDFAARQMGKEHLLPIILPVLNLL